MGYAPRRRTPVLLAALLLTTALAAKGSADALEGEWRSLQLLQPDPSRYRIVEDPFVIREGPVTVTVREGVLVPVFSGYSPQDRAGKRAAKLQAWKDDQDVPVPGDTGTKQFVGFAFADAVADVSVSWVERSDNLVFANHRVRNLGEPREALAAVAKGEPWTTTASEGMVLSIDPAVLKLFLGPDQDSDPFEVVVYADKPKVGARARASELVRQRAELMAKGGLSAGRWVASDRVAAARGLGAPTGDHAVLDLHVDTNLGSLADAARTQPSGVDWLTVLRDETGSTDSRRRIRVSALDRDARGRLISDLIVGVPFPPANPDDPFSAPVAPVRMESRDAFIDLLAVPRAADIEVEVHARLRLTAVGGPQQWFDLNIPRAGNPKAFEVHSVERLDGVTLLAETPLIRHDPVLVSRGEPDPDEGDDPSDDQDDRNPGDDPGPKHKPADPYLERPESRVTITLPEPLKAGESVVLDVVWRDVWPWANVLLGGLMSAGEGSGQQDVVPRLAGSPVGNPSKFRMRVRTPTRSRLRAALSGTTTREWTEGEWTLVEAGNTEHAVPWATVALSRFTVHDEPPAADLPGVRTRLLSDGGAAFASETRRLIGFYEGYLPTYPWPEHEIFQAPSQINGFVWVASHELTKVMTALTTGMMGSASLGRGGNVANRVFAHEIAHQWWGHLVRPAHADDFWIAETFAESFACMYMEAAFGACDRLMSLKRDTWEEYEASVRMPRASLTDAYSSAVQPAIVYDYGPYVFQQMLRPRIGHLGYHAALDVLMQDHAHAPVTTEHLEDYFSRATNSDLSAFFDFWVYGGFIPEAVELTWRMEGGRFIGEVTTDVPFGTFDVPVVLDGVETWVVVTDG
ncbi:MAG: hypothetical protein ACI8PZ_006786, partial [Myxococcota bacterium]